MKTVRAIALLGMMSLLTVAADACPMCQAGATKRTQKAYEETTAILALLPIIGGGSIFYWLYSRNKRGGE